MSDRDAPSPMSRSKLVRERIRSQILDGRLKPGARLVEDRLSDRKSVV